MPKITKQLLALLRNGNIGIPLVILSILAMVILPLPPAVLDILFTFNIVLAVMVLFCGDDEAHVGAIEVWHNDPAVSHDMSLLDGYYGTAELFAALDGHQPHAYRGRALLTIRGEVTSGRDQQARLLGPLCQSIGQDARRQLQPAMQAA